MRMVVPHTRGRLLNELSSDLNAFFESILGEEVAQAQPAFVPKMDLEERDDLFELSVDLPGVIPEDVHVDMDEDHLVIHGTRHHPNAENAEMKGRVERSFGDFRRAVRLPKAVDKDAIIARCEHGVLTVTLPRVAKSGSRRIVVSHSDATDDAADSQPSQS